MEKIELTKKEREILPYSPGVVMRPPSRLLPSIFRIVSIRELLSEELTYF